MASCSLCPTSLARLPRSMHVQLTAKAKTEGVSVNSLVLALIAEGLGKRNASRVRNCLSRAPPPPASRGQRNTRATMVPYIGRSGSRQSDLTARSGLTKQAVQQLIDALVRDGVVERRPDPDDARGRLVYFSAAGIQLLADANVVKRRTEQEFNCAIGAAAVARLNTELARLIGSDAESQ